MYVTYIIFGKIISEMSITDFIAKINRWDERLV